MSPSPRPSPRRRVNVRAVAWLAASAAVLVPGWFGVRAYQAGRGRAALLRQAEAELSGGHVPRALSYFDAYLERAPTDAGVLARKGAVLADHARTDVEAAEAAGVLALALGRTPEGPARQELRRRLVRLDLRTPSRARAAEARARALVRLGADDAEAHRLLARSLEHLGVLEGRAERFEEARREYEAAEARGPGDVEGAERLAQLYRYRLDDPARAGAVLDHLVDASARSGDPARHAAALLARARHGAALGRLDRAEADVAAAREAAPGDPEVRLAAARLALARGDAAGARRHLLAVGPARRDDPGVRELEGLAELADGRPEAAVAAGRAGLRRAGGGDADLTWRLAQALLDLGRVAEAGPLVDQYRRLTGGDAPNPRARYLRALLLLKGDRPAEAAAEAEPARDRADRELAPRLHYLLGAAYEGARRSVRAADAYRAAAEASPAWPAPRLALARLQQGARPLEALAELDRGLEQAPGDPALLAAKARLLRREQADRPAAARDWSAAERRLAEARRAAPDAPEVVLAGAELLADRGQPGDALALLEEGVRRAPKAAPLWLALADARVRGGRLALALEALDRADGAAGPRAEFVVTRASVLALKGQVGAAREALRAGAARVPEGERAPLWKALGDLDRARKDDASARLAYAEWARLQPESPDPRLAAFELALAGGDEAEIGRAAEALQRVGGPSGVFGRYARVEALLRDRPGEPSDPGRDARRRSEARALVAEVKAADPLLPLGPLLEGRLFEAEGAADRALAAYREALRLEGGAPAVARLVRLLARSGRADELAALRADLDARAPDLGRLASALAPAPGDPGRAGRLAALAAGGDPRGLDPKVWKAEVLDPLGTPAEAEAATRAALGRAPDDPAPRLQLLMLQVLQGKKAEAVATAEGLGARPGPPDPAVLAAAGYRAAGDLRRAGLAYREALARAPGDPAVVRPAVGFYEQNGDPGAAEAALRALLKRDPRDAWAARTLARGLAARTGDRAAWEEALRLVGPEARPDDVPDDLLARADVYARSPDPALRPRAVALLEGLVREVPERADVRLRLARLLFADGRLEPARAHASRAASGDRPDPDAVLFYAGVLLALKDYDAVEGPLERLAAADPDGLPVAEVRARLLAGRGQGAQAADVLERAFLARADGPEAFAVGAGMVPLLTSLGQPEAAERVARRLASTGPKGACLLADRLAAGGKTDEALALVREAAGKGEPEAAGAAALALALRPGADPRWLPLAAALLDDAARSAAPPSPALLGKQALARHVQGRYAEEVETYRALLDRKPADFGFLNNLAWTLSEDLGRPAEGLKWADAAVEKAGPGADVLDTRGVILTRLGRLDDALRDLRAAALQRPEPPTLFHLARALARKGRAGEARDAFRRARDAGLGRDRLPPNDRPDWDALARL